MPDDRAERKRPGRPFLGWRYQTLVPRQGRRRAAHAPERVDYDLDWEKARLRAEAETNRPLLFGLCLLVLIGTVLLLLTIVGVMPLLLSLVGCLACLAVAFPVLLMLIQSRSDMGELLSRERAKRRAEQERRERELWERQEEHAARYTEWQHRKRVYEAQPRWYAVEIPEGTQRVAAVGGAEAGWSALLTTLGAALIKEGGDLTVVDLSGRAVAEQFVSLTQRCGLIPGSGCCPPTCPGSRSALTSAPGAVPPSSPPPPRPWSPGTKSLPAAASWNGSSLSWARTQKSSTSLPPWDCSPSPTTATPPTIRPTSCSPGKNAKNSAPRSPTSLTWQSALPRCTAPCSPSKDWGSRRNASPMPR